MDAKEIDGIFWMRIEDVKENKWKFTEKSRTVW